MHLMHGDWLNKQFLKSGKTKSGLAALLGIPAPRINDIINDKRKIQLNEVSGIAQYFNLTEEEVLELVMGNLSMAAENQSEFLSSGSKISKTDDLSDLAFDSYEIVREVLNNEYNSNPPADKIKEIAKAVIDAARKMNKNKVTPNLARYVIETEYQDI